MKKPAQNVSRGFSKKAVDRRTFLKIAAATAGPLVIEGFPSVSLFAAEPRLELEDPAYEALYSTMAVRAFGQKDDVSSFTDKRGRMGQPLLRLVEVEIFRVSPG